MVLRQIKTKWIDKDVRWKYFSFRYVVFFTVITLYDVMEKHEECLPYDYLYIVNYILGRGNTFNEWWNTTSRITVT